MPQDLHSALSSYRDLLGEHHVITSDDALLNASTATFPTESRVVAIVQPESTADVQECMRIANRHRVPVYPVSRGRNWGLGSKVPPRNSVMMDLSRMNDITELDEQLGYMVLQPGVTFQQASDFLLQQQSEFFLPMIGGSPLGSIIGNIVERGEGVGPHGQRADFSANMEAVLPSGECIRTAFGKYDNASSRHVHQRGVGPSLDGVLAQSNLGIVTRLTVWLTPRPPVLRSFAGRIAERSNVELAVDDTRWLLLHRVVEANGIGIWNNHKMAATLGSYPWEAMEGCTPVDPERFPSEPWIVGGAIYAASDGAADASCDLIEARLRQHTIDWNWCDDASANSIYYGVPTEQNVRCAYWRKKTRLPSQIDPDADRCGLIWMCFAIPLLGSEMMDVLNCVEPVILQHGLEPNIGFNCLAGRCAHMYISLIYDRDVDGEDARAVACHDEVLKMMTAKGHYPYRLSLLSMTSLPQPDDDSTQCLDAIKRTLDPNAVLAPGRYL